MISGHSQSGKQQGQPAPDEEKGEGTEHSPLVPRDFMFSDSLKTMSGTVFVINMFADICPLGFLPLSSGLKSTGYVPALLLMFVACFTCIYTMGIVGQTASITTENTVRSQWVATLGKQTEVVPVLVIFLATLGSCVVYSRFCADLFADSLPCFGLNLSRDACLCLFTSLVLMPLCMLKNLSSFSWSSSVAVVLMSYTACLMVLRAVDGTYASGGKYFQYMPHEPYVPRHHFFEFGIESIHLVNYLALAFLAHCNACKYYRELSNRTPRHMRMHSALAMGVTAAFYAVMMIAGFQTFGTGSHAVILENYVKQDALANIAQIGVACSILASFPIMFSALREALIELLCIMWPSLLRRSKTTVFHNLLSVVGLWLITLLAHIFTRAGCVAGVVGAVCGSAAIYIVPCIIYEAALVKFCNKDEHYGEIIIARTMTFLGLLMAVLGCVSAFWLMSDATTNTRLPPHTK